MSTVQGPIGMEVITALSIPPVVTSTQTQTLDLSHTAYVYSAASANGTWRLPSPTGNGNGFLFIFKNDTSGTTLRITSPVDGTPLIREGGSPGVVQYIDVAYGGALWLKGDGTYWQMENWFQPG